MAFQWVLDLVDKVSKPAKDAESALGGFGKEMKKVEAQIERIKAHPVEFKGLQKARKELRELSQGPRSFAQRFEEMNASIRRVGFVQNLMLGAEALKIGYEVGEKLADVVLDIGKEMVNAAAGAEHFEVAFKGMLGAEQGSEVLEYIERIGKHTELTQAQLKGLSAELLHVGFTADELTQVLPASLDIAGFLGTGAAGAEAAATALSHIKTTGEISKKSLGLLGITYEQIMAEMRKETGLTDKEIEKKMSSGHFGAQALHGVLQTVANQAGGALGNQAEKMSKTVQAKLVHLKELPELIFEKWSKSPGFAKFSDQLSKILDKLDPDGPTGKKIYAALDKASRIVLKLVDKFTDSDAIDRFIGKVEWVVDHLEDIPDILDDIVTGVEVIGTVWAGVQIVNGLTALSTVLPAVGTGAGVATAGIAAMAAPLIAATVAAVALYEILTKLDEASKNFDPKHIDKLAGVKDSEILRRADIQTLQTARTRLGKGLDLTVEERSAIDRSGLSLQGFMSTVPSQSNGVAAGKGAGGNTQHLTVAPGAVVIHTDSSASPDEIAHKVSTALPGATQQAMERMAVSSGAL